MSTNDAIVCVLKVCQDKPTRGFNPPLPLPLADISTNTTIVCVLKVCQDKPTRRPSRETDATRPTDEKEVRDFA